MKFIGNSNEYLRLSELNEVNKDLIFEVIVNDLKIIWNTDDYMLLVVDGIPHQLKKNDIVFLTGFHTIDRIDFQSARLIRFNRSFFCVVDHDSEVGCKGILFFGSANLPVVSVGDGQLDQFEILWKMFRLEMISNDKLQMDMLQVMLKRFLILCTRNLIVATQSDKLGKNQLEIVREFNFLVESNFLRHHDVAFYASLLNRSPKTLSNLFSMVANKTPLSMIHDRVMLHAKRRIQYSDNSIKEIAYELGFEDIQTFSRFFKNKEGVSPSEYREKLNVD